MGRTVDRSGRTRASSDRRPRGAARTTSRARAVAVAVGVVVTSGLGGCVVGPDAGSPAIPPPSEFSQTLEETGDPFWDLISASRAQDGDVGQAAALRDLLRRLPLEEVEAFHVELVRRDQALVDAGVPKVADASASPGSGSATTSAPTTAAGSSPTACPPAT